MKENKNNELKKDALEQVAGGGPVYDGTDVKAMLAGVEQIMAAVKGIPPSDPNRRIFLEAAQKLSAQALDASNNLAQELQIQGERIKAIEKSLGIN